MSVSLLLAALVAGTNPTAPAPIKSTAELVKAMHDKYPNWYRKLSFVQKAIFADGRPEEEWWEAALIPGRLRIDIAPVDSGKAVIYKGDSNVVFQNGKRVARKARNILLVMAFDVYAQPPERTIELVKEEGFDVTKFRSDTWKGAPVYVIGGAGQELWVEKQRLILLRVLEAGPNGAPTDISFDKFQPIGNGWIGTQVLFLRGGKEYFREVYRDWKVNDAVTEDLFATDVWKRAAWIPKP